MILKPEKWSAI